MPTDEGEAMTGQQMSMGLSAIGAFGEITIKAEHDQVWLHAEVLDYSEREEPDDNEDLQYGDPSGASYINPAPMAPHVAATLSHNGWFIDVDVGSWSHYACVGWTQKPTGC
jgi:hypothetical protein